MAISSGILVGLLGIGIIMKVGKSQEHGVNFFPWRKEKDFGLEKFMEARAYQLDTYKWVDFNQDGVVDIIATGVKEEDKKQEWKLFLIDGKDYEIIDSDEGEVWPEGHRLEVKRIRDVYHIIYNHTKEYGESMIYDIVDGEHLKPATLSGDHYWIKGNNENQVSISFEGQKYKQLFNVAEGKYDAFSKECTYLTHGTSYYFEEDYLVNMQYISFPDIYDTAGFGMNAYYKWENEKWTLTQVIYSNGPEFTMVR